MSRNGWSSKRISQDPGSHFIVEEDADCNNQPLITVPVPEAGDVFHKTAIYLTEFGIPPYTDYAADDTVKCQLGHRERESELGEAPKKAEYGVWKILLPKRRMEVLQSSG